MKKIFILVLLIFLLSCSKNATYKESLNLPSSVVIVKGYIVDSVTKMPIKSGWIRIGDKSDYISSDGSYQIVGLSQGTYDVDVSISGYERFYSTLEISSQNIISYNIFLTPVKYGTLHGKVIDAETGNLLVDTSIRISDKIFTTSQNGEYQISNIPVGKQFIYVKRYDSVNKNFYYDYVSYVLVKEGRQNFDIKIPKKPKPLVITYPQDGEIISDVPVIFRWNAYEDAKEYKISVTNKNYNPIWHYTTSSSEVQFNINNKAIEDLISGNSYYFYIRCYGKNSELLISTSYILFHFQR